MCFFARLVFFRFNNFAIPRFSGDVSLKTIILFHVRGGGGNVLGYDPRSRIIPKELEAFFLPIEPLSRYEKIKFLHEEGREGVTRACIKKHFSKPTFIPTIDRGNYRRGGLIGTISFIFPIPGASLNRPRSGYRGWKA